MKNLILMIGILASTPSFAADDGQVARGIEQVRRARLELADFMRSLPRPLRGYADKVAVAQEKLERAEATLQGSFQGGGASSYVCSVRETGFNKVYVGRASTQTEAYANALNECSSRCNTFGYENLGCEAAN